MGASHSNAGKSQPTQDTKPKTKSETPTLGVMASLQTHIPLLYEMELALDEHDKVKDELRGLRLKYFAKVNQLSTYLKKRLEPDYAAIEDDELSSTEPPRKKAKK